MKRAVTLAKFNDNVPNEDCCFASPECIVVSDGAGGCGLYADHWSQYLVDRLDKTHPINSYGEFDNWIDSIWEEFYNMHEIIAKEGDCMQIAKFYEEGSCATVAAAWRTSHGKCHWIAYGDSVVFHYSRKDGLLQHSFGRLADFSNPPRLVSCKDPIEEIGFKKGEFILDDSSVVFAASDALSHYIIMMYEISKYSEYQDELNEELNSQKSNLQLSAQGMKIDFYKDVIMPLQKGSASADLFEKHVKGLYANGLIDMDDFTIAFLKYDIESCNK